MFPVPPHLCKEYGLTENAFNLGIEITGAAVEVYMEGGAQELEGKCHRHGPKLVERMSPKSLCAPAALCNHRPRPLVR